MSDPRRRIPGVDGLLEARDFEPLLAEWPRSRVVAALRAVVDDVRERVGGEGAEGAGDLTDPGRYASETRRRLERQDRPSLRRVINATGVVLHTNLGRAPLAEAAHEAMSAAARGYSNLEYDLDRGRRGSRYTHCVDLLVEITGAEDGLVVNNCAAALVLALNTLARGGPVLVSRGELVEIGGGFRIPEMLERAGAILVEVGSTNRTRQEDYRRAAEERGARAILKVHRSNFTLSGFTESVELDSLAEIARELDVPLVHDLGSGLLADPESMGLPDEPRPQESVARGADLVTFSGDKLLGGPQAGLIVGTGEQVVRLRENPLCRALRVDKVTLAGLEATLRSYRDPETVTERLPALRALAVSSDGLETRARRLAERLVARGLHAEATECAGCVGGGTYPGVELPSWAVRVVPHDRGVDRVAAELRAGDPPVVGRVEEGGLLLDLRTVLPEEEERLERAVLAVLSGARPEGEGEEGTPGDA